MNLFLSNNGFIVDEKIKLNSKPESVKIAFIISATTSMIADHPKKEDIEEDLTNLCFSDMNKLISLQEVIIVNILKSNKERINEYGKNMFNKNFLGYEKPKSVLTIGKSVKTGVLIDENGIKAVKLLSLNNPHPVIYNRDFIGYFFEISIKGRIKLFFEDKKTENAEISLTKIPVLAFKSENSINNEKSLKISREILKKITGKTAQILTN